YTIAFGSSSALGSSYLSGSDNNNFYAGTPGTKNLILYDGNSSQTLTQLKSYLDPKDLNSVTVMPAFVNSTVKPYNLHISPGIPTQLESGGQPITSPLAISTDYDGDTRSATFPDIGADEFNGIKVDLTAPLLSYTPLGNAGSGNVRTLTITLTDPSGVPVSGSGLPILYWKKNAGSYTAVTAASLGNNNYSFSFGAGTVTADVVYYYIVMQDQVATPNVGCYPYKGAAGFTASPPAVSTPPATPLSYTVKIGISGVVTVGSGGNYATLSALFTAINNSVVNGNINAQIISNITSGQTGVKLNQWIEDPPNSNYSLTIRPDSEVVRTISGGLVYNVSGSGLISLNGAKNVSIIGDIASPVTPGTYLTFRNTTAGGLNPSANTFYITNGSICTISYCDIQNNFLDPANSGGSDIDIESGTNNVTINNCKIHDAVADIIGLVKYALYSNGNNQLNILNNNFYNCGVGIYLDGAGSGGIVTGNSFYYNASPTAIGSVTQAALWTGGNGLVGVGGWNISNNYIGGSAPLCGGTPWTNTSVYTPGGTSISYAFMGIGFRGNSSTLSLIQNNTIQNIAFSYGDMCGIRFSGNMSISGNTIGDPANITKLIHGTDYGSKGSFGIYGESNSSGVFISNIENNTIANLYCCNVAGSGSCIIAGMRFEQNCNVRKNKMWGFGFQSVGGSTAPAYLGLYGIYYYTFQSNASSYEISNNMISLHAIGIASPAIYGIYDASTYSSVQINYYFNTVVLNGSSNGANNTFAFERTSANIMTLKDNLLINNITEAGTGKHFAIASIDLTGNSLTSDYNNLYTVVPANLGSYPNTSSVTNPVTFAGWQSVITGDAHSSNEIITTVSSDDLHLSGPSIGDLVLSGIWINGITTDIDGDIRFGTPYMGADEVPGSPLPVELTSFTASVNGKNVLLTWSTASEKNAYYYSIERASVKNNIIQNDWIIAGEVKAAGNSLSPKLYSFIDKNISVGKFIYRLKMVDLDGSSSYSKSVESDIAVPKEFILSQNYPNPFNPSTKIDYQLPVDSKVVMEVFNIAGQKVSELVNKEQSAGYYTIDFGTSKLASGVYIYRLAAVDKSTGHNFSSIKKMILLK
ncbi:MAG: T9SS type A sorting domain-containing protein, partial [Ignavibacteriaceae bacterium]|nr:T9SS type A sorting domain-containing protein [Ignavibacteriaceae bacterium]